METPDYSDYQAEKTPPPSDALARLSELARQQRDLEEEIERKTEELKELSAEHRTLSWETIPKIMSELGLETVKTASGLTIKLKEDLRVSMPRDRADRGCEWLEQNGCADVVKRAFTILFGVGDEAWARKFESDLRRRKRQLVVDRTKQVHASTLKATIRQLLEEGVNVPMELFGAHLQTVSKIELAKSSKG